MTVHVCAPPDASANIFRSQCPTCERQTYLVDFFVEWYGSEVVCLKCGERWMDGERMERPFKPGWRQDSIRRAKARYRRFKGDESG